MGRVSAILAALAALAILAANPAPPPAFTANVGAARIVDGERGLYGLAWPCEPGPDGEECYAGLERSPTGDGGHTWVLTTGP